MKKKIFTFLLAGFVLATVFTACSAKAKENTTEVKQETTGGPIHITKAEFLTKISNFEANPKEWKYLGDKPCIIDFYATWCGPCKQIAPVLEELAKEYEGQIYIYKVDTDKEPELAAAFGIQSIPTLYFCPMEGTPQTVMGAMPKESFVKAINEILLKK